VAKFETTPYETDDGKVLQLRVSGKELAAMAASDKKIDFPFHALNSGSRRRYGVHPRGVRLTRSVGADDSASKKTTFLAYPTALGYKNVKVDDEITIGAIVWKVSAKVPELLV
jgi:hypothetical protein